VFLTTQGDRIGEPTEIVLPPLPFFRIHSEEARVWSNASRIATRRCSPNDGQAGVYSSTMHY